MNNYENDDEYDDEDNHHEILVNNHFRHIPGPAGEIFISDDHLKNQQLYQQQFTQMQQSKKNSSTNNSINNNNNSNKEKKLQEEFEKNLRNSLEKFLIDNGLPNGMDICRNNSVIFMKSGNHFEKKVTLAAMCVKNVIRYDSVQSASVLLCDFYRSPSSSSIAHHSSSPQPHGVGSSSGTSVASSNTSGLSDENLIEATIHRSVIEKYPHVLTPGTLLLLKKFCLFHPSPRTHHLILTPKNIVNIFSSGAAQKRIEKSLGISSSQTSSVSSSSSSSSSSTRRPEKQTDRSSVSTTNVDRVEESRSYHHHEEERATENVEERRSHEQLSTVVRFSSHNKDSGADRISNDAPRRPFVLPPPPSTIKQKNKRTLEEQQRESVYPKPQFSSVRNNSKNNEIDTDMEITDTMDVLSDAKELLNYPDQASQVLIPDGDNEQNDMQINDEPPQKKARLMEDDDEEEEEDNVSDDKQQQQTQSTQSKEQHNAPADDFDMFNHELYADEEQDERHTLGDHIDNLEVEDIQNEDEFF